MDMNEECVCDRRVLHSHMVRPHSDFLSSQARPMMMKFMSAARW